MPLTNEQSLLVFETLTVRRRVPEQRQGDRAPELGGGQDRFPDSDDILGVVSEPPQSPRSWRISRPRSGSAATMQ